MFLFAYKVGPGSSFKWALNYSTYYRGEITQFSIYKVIYRGYHSIYN